MSRENAELQKILEAEAQKSAERADEQKITGSDWQSRMQQSIAGLERRSPFTRKQESATSETLQSPEGERFSLERLQDPKDPSAKEMHKRMKEIFGKEADDWATVKEGLEDPNMAYHVMRDRDQRVTAFSNANYLPMEGRGKEGMLAVWYTGVEAGSRGKGASNELYRKMYQFGLERAQAEGQKLSVVAGETTNDPAIERVVNRPEIGRARAYFEDKQGNIHEVPYFSSPTEWDEKGKAEGEATARHLTLGFTDGSREASVDRLMRTVETLSYNALPYESEYSPQAYSQIEKAVEGQLEQLRQALAEAKGGKVFLMSADEREARKQELAAKGKELIEHAVQ